MFRPDAGLASFRCSFAGPVLHALGIGRMSLCTRFVSSVFCLAKTVRWCRCHGPVRQNASDQTPQSALPITWPADGAVHVRGFGACVDRKSTRLNSSHVAISYAVFCLKKKTQTVISPSPEQTKKEEKPI